MSLKTSQAQGLLLRAMQEAMESPTGFKIRVSSASSLKNHFYSLRRKFPEYSTLRLLATPDPSVFILFLERNPHAQEIRNAAEEADDQA